MGLRLFILGEKTPTFMLNRSLSTVNELNFDAQSEHFQMSVFPATGNRSPSPPLLMQFVHLMALALEESSVGSAQRSH